MKAPVLKACSSRNSQFCKMKGHVKNVLLITPLLLGVIYSGFPQVPTPTMESARAVGKNNIEMKGGLSVLRSHFGDETNISSLIMSYQAAFGFSNETSLGLRYDNSPEYGFISLIPKYSAESIFGFIFPIGFGIGDMDDDSFQIELRPTCLFSFPKNIKYIEATIAPGMSMNISGEGFGTQLNVEFNAGFSSNFDVWTIRPSFGFYKYLGEGSEGYYWDWGISFVFKLDTAEKL